MPRLVAICLALALATGALSWCVRKSPAVPTEVEIEWPDAAPHAAPPSAPADQPDPPVRDEAADRDEAPGGPDGRDRGDAPDAPDAPDGPGHLDRTR